MIFRNWIFSIKPILLGFLHRNKSLVFSHFASSFGDEFSLTYLSYLSYFPYNWKIGWFALLPLINSSRRCYFLHEYRIMQRILWINKRFARFFISSIVPMLPYFRLILIFQAIWIFNQMPIITDFEKYSHVIFQHWSQMHSLHSLHRTARHAAVFLSSLPSWPALLLLLFLRAVATAHASLGCSRCCVCGC